jgi:hypothetical protein
MTHQKALPRQSQSLLPRKKYRRIIKPGDYVPIHGATTTAPLQIAT